MKLYSDEYCDEVVINENHYTEFCEKIAKSAYYEETRVNDLIYFAYEMFRGMKNIITKHQLLLTIVDLVDVIPIDRITGLKRYELKYLLKASKDNYLAILNNTLIDDTLPDGTAQYELVDSE